MILLPQTREAGTTGMSSTPSSTVTWRSWLSHPGSMACQWPLLFIRLGGGLILPPLRGPLPVPSLLSQVQPFFSSCLNDCIRHTKSIPCPGVLERPGERNTSALGYVSGVRLSEDPALELAGPGLGGGVTWSGDSPELDPDCPS